MNISKIKGYAREEVKRGLPRRYAIECAVRRAKADEWKPKAGTVSRDIAQFYGLSTGLMGEAWFSVVGLRL